MKKRILLFYILLVLILMSAYMINIRSVSTTIENDPMIIKINTFKLTSGELLSYEKKIKPEDIGVFEYEATISGDMLDVFSTDLTLVVTRPRGNWHKIYWNGSLIGEIGTEGLEKNNVWNETYRFSISKDLIKETNTLSFRTFSDYKIGFGTIPVLVFGELHNLTLFRRIKLLHGNFNTIASATLISIASIQLVFFSLSKKVSLQYGLFPITVLCCVVYLLDYSIISYAPLSSLAFKKIIFFALYTTVVLASYSLSKIYQKRSLLYYAISAFMIANGLVLTAPNMYTLSSRYGIANIFVLFALLGWFVISLKRFFKFFDPEDGLIAFASLLLLVPGVLDNFFLLGNSGKSHRLIVIGVTFYAIAILLYTLYHFIEDQKAAYHEKKLLVEERERLKKSLVTDELTGLPNHRAYYEIDLQKLFPNGTHCEVLYIDIDQFRIINNTLGHGTGDAILKQMGKDLAEFLPKEVKLFRYGGEEFVAVSPLIYQLGERIRKHILKNESLSALSGHIPVTVSIGVAQYPKHGHSPQTLILKAEKCTQFAKITGRNRVCYYRDTIEAELKAPSQSRIKENLVSDFVLTLASAIDLKDVYTGRHSEEVARYALLIADELELSNSERVALKMGSLLHDIGKIAIPDSILSKSDKLTPDEYQTICKHVEFGSNLVSEILDNTMAIACVRNHHERYDGLGYPDGLKGEDIPKLARLVCIADAYHAMISSRPYRKAMDRDDAIEELIRHSGTQFDPNFVEIMVRLYREGSL